MLEPSKVPRKRDSSTAKSVHPLSGFGCLSNVSVLWVLRWPLQSLLGCFYSTFQVKKGPKLQERREKSGVLSDKTISWDTEPALTRAGDQTLRLSSQEGPGSSYTPGPAERQGLQTQLHQPPRARHQSLTRLGAAKDQQLLSFLLKSTCQEKHQVSPHHCDPASCSSCVVVWIIYL